MEQYKSLLWSFGEKPERSMKRNEEEKNNIRMDTTLEINTILNNNDMNNNTMLMNNNTMLMNNNTMLDTTIENVNINTNTNMSMSISQMGEFRKTNNKRELVNSKLDERYSIGHIGQNPFNRENDYMKDLENQQKFMIPKSSYDEKM
jgi:hypothetical protein